MKETLHYTDPGDQSEMSPEELMEYFMYIEMFGNEEHYIIKKPKEEKKEDNPGEDLQNSE